MLLYFAGFFVFFGFGLVSLGFSWGIFVLDFNVFLPVRLIEIFILTIFMLGTFIYASGLLFGAVFLMLFDS